MLEYLQKCNLEGLVQINSYTFRCRCPICGDSLKTKSKKRFYIFLAENYVYCHKCKNSYSIPIFLKLYYPEIYKEYLNETVLHKKEEVKIDFSNNNEKIEKSKLIEIGKKYNLINNVLSINFVKDYLSNRNLLKFYNKFWYIDNFINFRKELLNQELSKIKYDPRLLIPFVKNSTKEIYAIQARSLINQEPKYLTILLNKDYYKLYNYYNIDKTKEIYLLEGAIDSLFLSNSFALAGSKINKEILNEIKKLNIKVVLDNDFIYNIDIRNTLKMFINEGLKVFIPSKNILQYKDINEMRNKYSENEIKEIIDSNIYSGIMAKTKLSQYLIKKLY